MKELSEEELFQFFCSRTPEELRVIKYLASEHKCSFQHKCCEEFFCNACYIIHLKTFHSQEALRAAKTFQSSMHFSFSVERKEREEFLGSKNISASSKGRIKCCGKFRSIDRNWVHQKKFHSKGELEKSSVKRIKVSSVEETIMNLSNEQKLELYKLLLESGEL